MQAYRGALAPDSNPDPNPNPNPDPNPNPNPNPTQPQPQPQPQTNHLDLFASCGYLSRAGQALSAPTLSTMFSPTRSTPSLCSTNSVTRATLPRSTGSIRHDSGLFSGTSRMPRSSPHSPRTTTRLCTTRPRATMTTR